jgi:hypothetical protein
VPVFSITGAYLGRIVHKPHRDVASYTALVVFADGHSPSISPGETPGLAKRNLVAQVFDEDFDLSWQGFLCREELNGDGECLRPDVRIQCIINLF